MCPRLSSPTCYPKALDRQTLERLDCSRDYLAASLAEPVTLREAAAQAYLSPFHYHRLFRATYRETPHEFLTRRRVELAKELLTSSDLRVTQICLAVGYSSLGTFSSRFRQHVGCSPSAYRREARRFFQGFTSPPARFIPYCFAHRFPVGLR
jgi:AraC-like DNA-binding protein